MAARADDVLGAVLGALQGQGGCVIGERVAFADAAVEAAAVDIGAGAVAGAVAVRDALVARVRGEEFGALGGSH